MKFQDEKFNEIIKVDGSQELKFIKKCSVVLKKLSHADISKYQKQEPKKSTKKKNSLRARAESVSRERIIRKKTPAASIKIDSTSKKQNNKSIFDSGSEAEQEKKDKTITKTKSKKLKIDKEIKNVNEVPEGDIFVRVYGDTEENLKKKMGRIPKIPKKKREESPKNNFVVENSVENDYEVVFHKQIYSKIIDVGQKDEFANINRHHIPITCEKEQIPSLLDLKLQSVNSNPDPPNNFNSSRPAFQNQNRSDHFKQQINHVTAPIQTKEPDPVRETSKFDRYNKDSDDSGDEDLLFIDEKKCETDNDDDVPESEFNDNAGHADESPIIMNDSQEAENEKPITTNMKKEIDEEDNPEVKVKLVTPPINYNGSNTGHSVDDESNSLKREHQKSKDKKVKKAKMEVEDDFLSILPSDSDSFEESEEELDLRENRPSQNSKKTTLTNGYVKTSEKRRVSHPTPMQQQNDMKPKIDRNLSVTITKPIRESENFIRSPVSQVMSPPKAQSIQPLLTTNASPVNAQLQPPVIRHYQFADFSQEEEDNKKPLFSSPIRLNSPQVSPLTVNMCSNVIPQRTPRTIKLFENVCEFLLDSLCSFQECSKCHELPSKQMVEEVFRNSVDQAEESYDKYVRRYGKLFHKYFPIYAENFAQLKLIGRLESAINDCEHHKMHDYWHFIFVGFKKADVPPFDAINKFLQIHKVRTFAALDQFLIFMSSDSRLSIQFLGKIREFFFAIPGFKISGTVFDRFFKLAIHHRSYDIVCLVLDYLCREDVLISEIRMDQADLIEFFTLCHRIVGNTQSFKASISLVVQKLELDQQ